MSIQPETFAAYTTYGYNVEKTPEKTLALLFFPEGVFWQSMCA